MHPIPLVRYPLFGALLLCAIIVLGIDGHIISITGGSSSYVDPFTGAVYTASGSVPAYAGLGVATAVLTWVTIIPFTVIDFMRQGAITSFVVVELGWFFVLWILWLTTFGDTASNTLCNSSYANGDNYCSQVRAVEAFSFLAWFLLFAYWVALLVFSFLASSKGNTRIWFTSTREADFTAGSSGAPTYHASANTYPPHPSMVQQPQGYPPKVEGV